MTLPVPNNLKLTFTLVYSATGTDTSIEIPAAGATAAVGDFAVVFNQGDGAGPPANVSDSWSLDATDTTANSRASISSKILESGDLNAAKSGLNGSTAERWILLIFRPSRPLVSATAGAVFVSDSTSGNPAAQVIAASGAATLPVIAIGMWSEPSGSVDPRTMSPAMTAEFNADTHIYAQYIIYDAGPVDHTIDQDDEGTNNIIIGGWYEFATS